MKFFITLYISIFSLVVFAQQETPLNLEKAPAYVKEAIQSGRECVINGKLDCAPLYLEAIKRSKNENPECTGTLYGHLLNYFYHTGQDDSLLMYKNEAIDISIKHKENYNLSATYNLVAAAFMSGSNTDSALYYFQKAKDHILIIKNDYLLAENYMNTAGVYIDIKDYDKAQTLYLKASEFLKEENMDDMYLAVLYNLAENEFSREDFHESWKWAKKALPYLDKIEELDVYRPRIHDLISRLYMHDQKYDSAFYYVNKSIEESKLIADQEHLAVAYESKALILKNQGKTNDAIEAINYAIELNLEINNIKRLANCYNIVAELYYQNQNFKASADSYVELLKLNDSILSENRIFAIQEFEKKYETEKKEKQIAEQELKIQKQRSNLLYAILGGSLLVTILGGIFIYNVKAQKLRVKQLQQEKENAILNSFILGEERERKRISEDLHDGVAAMIAAAKMSLDAIPHLTEEKRLEQIAKVKDILENTHADVRHIAHNLLPTVLEKEGIIKATSHFAFEINQTNLLKINVVDNKSYAEKLPLQFQLMLFRMIQELVNNIVKHSQAKNAAVTFSTINNSLLIEITDDGIGYEDNNESGNQGLYSINQRLKSIGGNFNIKKRKSGGTEAKLELNYQ